MSLRRSDGSKWYDKILVTRLVRAAFLGGVAVGFVLYALVSATAFLLHNHIMWVPK